MLITLKDIYTRYLHHIRFGRYPPNEGYIYRRVLIDEFGPHGFDR
jgi:hypothetical protein